MNKQIVDSWKELFQTAIFKLFSGLFLIQWKGGVQTSSQSTFSSWLDMSTLMHFWRTLWSALECRAHNYDGLNKQLLSREQLQCMAAVHVLICTACGEKIRLWEWETFWISFAHLSSRTVSSVPHITFHILILHREQKHEWPCWDIKRRKRRTVEQ